MLLVMALVVGYAHLSRPSRAAGNVSFVNPEGALCKWKRKGVPCWGGALMAAPFYSPNRPSPTRVYTKNFHPAGRSYEGHEAAAAAGGKNTILGRDSISSFWRRRADWITTVSSISMHD